MSSRNPPRCQPTTPPGSTLGPLCPAPGPAPPWRPCRARRPPGAPPAEPGAPLAPPLPSSPEIISLQSLKRGDPLPRDRGGHWPRCPGVLGLRMPGKGVWAGGRPESRVHERACPCPPSGASTRTAQHGAAPHATCASAPSPPALAPSPRCPLRPPAAAHRHCQNAARPQAPRGPHEAAWGIPSGEAPGGPRRLRRAPLLRAVHRGHKRSGASAQPAVLPRPRREPVEPHSPVLCCLVAGLGAAE